MSKKPVTKKPEDENLNLSSVADTNLINEPIKKPQEVINKSMEKKEDKEVALSKDNAPSLKDKKSPEEKEVKYEERQFVREILENAIKNANKQKNFHLASELHKANGLLSDLNHVFNHLNGEAKLVISLAFKKGKVIEV
jgi:hypothetical protein